MYKLNSFKISADACILTVCLYFVAAPHASAYVDVTAGSYVFQSILGSLLVCSFSVKTVWRKIKEAAMRSNEGG